MGVHGLGYLPHCQRYWVRGDVLGEFVSSGSGFSV